MHVHCLHNAGLRCERLPAPNSPLVVVRAWYRTYVTATLIALFKGHFRRLSNVPSMSEIRGWASGSVITSINQGRFTANASARAALKSPGAITIVVPQPARSHNVGTARLGPLFCRPAPEVVCRRQRLEKHPYREYALLIGFRTANARTPVKMSIAMMMPNTGSQLPVASCRRAASGPPSTEPIPCAIYKNP